MTIRALLCAAVFAIVSTAAHAATPVRIATFQVDATPPIGSPLGDAQIKPAAKIDDALTCRGVVLLTEGKPIVLCVLDWIGIGNGGHEAWRAALAEAAGTTPDRVAVHCTHAHDAPGCDFEAEAMLTEQGLSGAQFDVAFTRKVMADASAAIRQSLKNPQTVTHIGTGKAKVEKVASSRRVLGTDGKIKWVRWTATKDPEVRAAPEGVYDPYVYIVSFWNGDKPLTAMSYYATHPQSHYGKGAVSCDVPGLARNLRQTALGIPVLHFNGAGGDVSMGKYNDGDPANRPVLTERLADGMAKAWDATIKTPVTAADVAWRVEQVSLPLATNLDERKQRAILADAKQPVVARVNAARELAWIDRCKAGDKVDLACLAAGPLRILHMPGELSVEYQLAAARMRPDLFVTMAAYGDYGMGYICAEVHYAQGGYESEPGVSLVAPKVEDVLMPAIKKLVE